MKKWFYLMLAAILPVMAMSLTSCNDDDDLPNVDISLEIAQATVVDGTIYVVQGDTIDVTAIKVVNNEANKEAALTNVTYYWDGLFYAPAVFAPFGMLFPTSDTTPVGNHSINITCTVLAVDKTIATATVTFPVKVVASADEIPAGSTSTLTATTALK